MARSIPLFLGSLLRAVLRTSWTKYTDGISSYLPHIRWSCFGDGYLLRSRCGHNDFQHESNTGSRFFIIVTGADVSDLWVGARFNKNVDMSTGENPVISNLMDLKLITIPTQTVFVCHRCLYYAGTA